MPCYSADYVAFGITANASNRTTAIAVRQTLPLFGCVLNVLRDQCISGTIHCMCLKGLGRSVLTFGFSLGSFVLLGDPTGSNKLYPAEIISRSSRSPVVNLRWYSGNLLPGGNCCADFQIPLSHCLDALFRDLRTSPQSVSVCCSTPCQISSSSKIGMIKVPIRILEDLGDSGITYSNSGIQAAMIDAFPMVLNIARRACHHPLWDVYQKWVKANSPSEQSLRATSDFMAVHLVPILPGDAALSEPLLTRLLGEAVPDPDTAVFVIARILFGLVALRTYLGLQPSHDAHIWRLWLEGRLKKRPTVAERVLQACTTIRMGSDANGIVSSIPYSESDQSGFKIIPCLEPCADDDSLLVDYPQIHWLESSEQQLSSPGAPSFVEAAMVESRSRPRPTKRARKPQLAPSVQ